jgi:hypothetical protein
MSTYCASPGYFSLQVKNKPNGGIAFPAFLLGAGTVTITKDLYNLKAQSNLTI